MNADQRRLKTTNFSLHYRCSSASIGGQTAFDWDRGKPHGSSPPTPPDMRVRIRRFGGLSDRLHCQSRNPERVEEGIRQCDAERG
jgi:hypothetical protein